MARARERVLVELGRLAAGEAEGPQRDFEEALRCEELQRAHSAIARAVHPRNGGGAFDTGRSEPIDAPPGWLPPMG